ncbi:MAG: diphthine--ammonia ligase [Thermodesulfobacteriota bacterium]
MDNKALFSWSGGKDSALALREILRGGGYDVRALITTVTGEYERVSMHGLRCALLERQTASLGLPLEKVIIPRNASNEEYERQLEKLLLTYKESGVSTVIFGDIFLEEIRKYREGHLDKIGLGCVFPIWDVDSVLLARTFIEEGFKAVTVCVDSKFLDRSFAGREFDRDFLSDLPAGIDPCGENGEFHTFTYDGPIFRDRIEFDIGEVVLRDNRFYFCDLEPQ